MDVPVLAALYDRDQPSIAAALSTHLAHVSQGRCQFADLESLAAPEHAEPEDGAACAHTPATAVG